MKGCNLFKVYRVTLNNDYINSGMCLERRSPMLFINKAEKLGDKLIFYADDPKRVSLTCMSQASSRNFCDKLTR